MSCITLPDGAQKKYEKTLTALDVARDIGTGLARVAIAAKVNGRLVDLSYCLPEGSEVDLAIVTGKDPEGLEVIRHSTAHLLAHAVKSLFPTVKIAMGPVIEDGFYYDFNLEHTLTPEDLPKIEKKMQELIKANYPIARRVLSRAEAIALFEQLNEDYKVKIIEELPEDSEITVYEQGDFIDLCRGPHVPSTGLLKAFKLTKLAGAYWLGDSDNEMLQRVYGTAWPDKQSLKDYLHRMEEAERRDHRLIAKKMDLFHLQPNAPGMVFWHAKGWTVIRLLREYIREVQQRAGYQEINTPQLVDAELWEQSGHLAKFGDDMFTIPTDRSPVVIKPMSCPCHVQVFKQGITSYRDLPLRLAEFGHCHRNEPSGTLHGLMRVRGFVQDDGHIFCEEQQIQPEVLAFIDQLREVYSVFGFDDIIYKLSTRPDQRIGSEEQWDRAEQALAQALDATDVEWGTLPGEGAFYGPKIEFSLKDCIGRVWQCGTIQVDFSMPGRLGAHYIDEQGDKKTPVMLHRAILGSCERFLAILIEHYEGRLPLWLAPIQLVAMGITDETHPYITKVVENLKNRGFRVISDLRNEKIGYKIREHTIARIPYQLVVGMREVEKGQVTIRADGDDLDGQSMPVEALIAILLEQIENKGK